MVRMDLNQTLTHYCSSVSPECATTTQLLGQLREPSMCQAADRSANCAHERLSPCPRPGPHAEDSLQGMACLVFYVVHLQTLAFPSAPTALLFLPEAKVQACLPYWLEAGT